MILALALAGCAATEGWTDVERARILALSPLPEPPQRPSNAVADLPAAAELGERLFFDVGFSADGQTSCGSCHLPERHFTDGEKVATALGTGTRNTPTIEASAWSTWYFWDGRADSAWAQATGPLRNSLEHGFDAPRVRARVVEAYAEPFATVFGGVAEDPDRVLAQVGKAIEAYERTLGPGAARFDRYAADLAAGRDSDVLSAEEKRGLKLFVGEAGGCVDCHNGPLFTDGQFHNLGLPTVPKDGIDPGRARGAGDVLHDPFNCLGAHSDTTDCPELRYLDPSFPDFAAAFKTPSLRNVTRTAPYMHDGQMATLEAVLLFYDTLPGRALVGHRELTLAPLRLSDADRRALVAFLGTLAAEGPAGP